MDIVKNINIIAKSRNFRQNKVQMRQVKQIAKKSLAFTALLLLIPAPSLAQTSSSTNYRVDQTFFGTGGELDASSTNYRSKQTAGELTVGNTASTNYQAFAGFNTTDDPFLEFVVTGNNIDLGYLDTVSAKTANGVFSVRAWQAGGYVVRTESDPPTNSSGGYQLAPLSSQTASSPGTAQFGINLKQNTSPTNFGTEPVGTSGFPAGVVSTGYNTANVFKYAKGDAIAQSNQSTSVTTFTISYLFNISSITPAGQYNFNHVLVATATY